MVLGLRIPTGLGVAETLLGLKLGLACRGS